MFWNPDLPLAPASSHLQGCDSEQQTSVLTQGGQLIELLRTEQVLESSWVTVTRMVCSEHLKAT